MALRILFLIHRVKKARHFDRVLAALAQRGHTVIMAAEQKPRSKPIALPKFAALANRRLEKRGETRTDRARGRVRYLAATSGAMQRRSCGALGTTPAFSIPSTSSRRSFDCGPQRTRHPAGQDFLEKHAWIRNQPGVVRQALAVAEDAIPSEKTFEDFITGHKPDLVLVTPLVNYGMYQTDYVKSAHRLGLPVGYLPFSWDNLTNRGLIVCTPTACWCGTTSRNRRPLTCTACRQIASRSPAPRALTISSR
jgi:hypothetical protein